MPETSTSSSLQEKASTLTSTTEQVIDYPDLAVRVMHRRGNGEFWCSLITIDCEDQGQDLVRKMRIKKENLPHAWSYFVDLALMQRDCIFLATISELEPSRNPDFDMEAQLPARKVYVHRQERNEMLTEALSHSKLLHSATRLVSNHLSGVIYTGSQSETQAIYVSKELSASLAAAWFGIALLLSIAAGIGVGFTDQDVSLGLGLGFGILGVLGPVQMILAWYASFR